MIYAIRAVGTEYIKFGKAKSVGKRLAELETGCPHDLEILAVADWPDEQERAVHRYLQSQAHRREWFKDGEMAQEVISWMADQENGMRKLLNAIGLTCERREIQPALKPKKARIEQEREEWAKVDRIRKDLANIIFGGARA